MPIWKQPLVHFLIIGGLFYAAVTAFTPDPETDGKTIVVDEAALLLFIQQRSQIFEPDYAAARLEGMSPAELALLKRDYVEEEALYREARLLGLEREDYVIRRRMVQKMDYAASSGGGSAFTDAQVTAFYARNAADYATPDTLYFDHIFARDSAALQRFAPQIGKSDFTQLGARFAYGNSFEGLSKQETSDIFGAAFADALWLRPADDADWQGPIPSVHGVHFVRLRRKEPARQPPLEEVRAAVEGDMRYEADQDNRIDAIQQIIGRYDVQDET